MNLEIVRIYIVPGKRQLHVEFPRGWIRFAMCKGLKFGKYGTTGRRISMSWRSA